MFEMETQHEVISLSTAAVTVKDELVKLWEHAGYGDILKKPSNILRRITSLHDSYKKLRKIPVSSRSTESFEKKEEEFTKSLENLFDITLKSFYFSNNIWSTQSNWTITESKDYQGTVFLQPWTD